jgi:hypothetical protein
MFRKTLLLIGLMLALATAPAMAEGMIIHFLLSGLNTLSGGTVNGGYVYSYAAGTTTAKSIYTTRAMTVAHDNPAQLDTDGRLIAYGEGVYKFIIKDMVGNTLFTVDNVEVSSIQGIFDDATDPFGDTLTQTNLIATDLSADLASVYDLTVTHGANIASLTVGNTPISGVATATLASQATNLGQVQALAANAMQADGSNASIAQDISMMNHKLTTLATGTAAQDAVSKGQVEAMLASYTPVGGSYMAIDGSNASIAQDISLANHKLTSVATATALQDAVNKGQMDAALADVAPAGISNIQIGSPTSPVNGDIWIEEP